MVVIRLVAVSLCVLVLSSCIGVTDPNRNQRSYGFILMDTELQNGEFGADVQATFFRGQTLQLPNVVPPQDQCSIFPFTEEDQVIELPSSISAGPSISLELSGNQVDLTPRTLGALLRYFPPDNELVPFQPGDTVHVSIPGSANFSQWNISGRTAEQFTFTPVDESGAAGPLQLRWTQPTTPNSKMLVSLRYATTTFPNRLAEQIFCELRDDGAFDIPEAITAGWRNAPPELRQAQFARWRVTIEQRDLETMLIVSTFLVPTTVRDIEPE